MKKNEKGMTLLEALVSTAIIGIGFVAVFQMVNYSVRSIGVSGERTKATYLASMVAEDIISEKHSDAPKNMKFKDYLLDLRGSGSGPSWSMKTCNEGSTTNKTFTDSFSNKKEKWKNRLSEKRIKCNRKNPSEKSLTVFDICNNNNKSNNCRHNNQKKYSGTGIYDKWYLGRMEVRVPISNAKKINNRTVKEKKRVLYFQIH